MSKIRVLIVDDSSLVRRLLSEIIAGDPDLDVAGTAPDGRAALAMLPETNPHAVILDVEMPGMDGLKTLEAIRHSQPALPVIMFSALTQRGAEVTLDALALGATDYVTKPTHTASPQAAMQCVREQLIPRIKTFCRSVLDPIGLAASGSAQPAAKAADGGPIAARPNRIDVVAIGVSTGGPNALEKLLPALPADFPVPILIAQHMPPMFTKLLANRLAAKSKIAVHEGSSGDVLRPATAWVAPGDFHMVLERRPSGVRIRTRQGPPENSCRPAADVLFRSVAEVFADRSLAVVMTGMGQDGLRGCEQIRRANGRIIVQDEATSVIWGMPGLVAEAGLAEKILPLDRLAVEINHRARVGRV
jgi:two-component system chemotaxis response regulator CheB